MLDPDKVTVAIIESEWTSSEDGMSSGEEECRLYIAVPVPG